MTGKEFFSGKKFEKIEKDVKLKIEPGRNGAIIFLKK